ncbi:MAG TPA: mechanosensitive ion channel domain-containing protein [Kofleriaceae bacterium]|jgi:small conductance mechanosensitive channel|nr:mechanosensitive ion channel domain-containing protein [Kofleriaceae bacterium]
MTASLEYVRHLAEGYLFPSGVRLIVAIAVFLIGRALARAVMRAFDRVMERAKIDVSLRKFLGDVGYAVMLLAVVIAALDTLGIKTTAVLAVLGAAGLAVGLALQGSLSNFAAGVMLIVLRPYKVSDIVVIGKYLGRIDAIKVFNTVMITSDYREITIPNGQIIAAPIENLTVLGRRRIDFLVSVPLTTNLAAVKAVLERVARSDDRIEVTPPPAIEVIEIADTAIKLRLRPWTSSDSYDQLATALMEQLKTEMQKAGLAFSVALQAQTA